nr:hypothetical protein [Tanacetum cinerariifolium]
MTLFNEICDNCIYEAGMPIICTACAGIVRGGLCLPCNLRENNLYNYDPNAYSFNNSNYIPQTQDENYLCNLCGNNSHDGYDCQQQFPFVYEQEPSYNQNYDDNYYPHESLSYPCCDYCRGSHETFQCQPDNQNVDFSGSDQIQTLQYPDVNPPSPEIKYDQSTSTDRPIFLNDNEDHPVQNKESLENSSEETVQKQKMEDTIFDLVKICHHKEFLCIHDDIDNIIESALDSKLLSINSINSQRLDKKEQKVKNDDDNFDSSDDESLPDEDVLAEEFKIYPNPLFDEDEINSNKLDPHCFNVEYDFVESLLNLQDGNSQQEEIDIVTDDVLPPSDDNDDDHDLLLEEVDLFLFDDSIPPGIENVDPEGDIRFLEELLINDSILSHELSDANFEDNPSISRPPSEPPDDNFDLEPEVISAVMTDIDEPDEHFNPGG